LNYIVVNVVTADFCTQIQRVVRAEL